MRNPEDVGGATHRAATDDSHAVAPKPRRRQALPPHPAQAKKSLDVSAGVPLHLRPVLTYAELDELGVVPERTLRRLVAVGRVKRAVLRIGRSVRFVVQDLLDELREVPE